MSLSTEQDECKPFMLAVLLCPQCKRGTISIKGKQRAMEVDNRVLQREFLRHAEGVPETWT
eukprot:scaffold32283_cov22-Tisochrysis_lutea.AAC.2